MKKSYPRSIMLEFKQLSLISRLSADTFSGILWGILFLSILHAQPSTNNFLRLDPDKLPSDKVHSILLDHHGFLWLGTENGLARYDGLDTKVYKADHTDSNSINSNFVISLKEGHAGRLWILTMTEGINVFDPLTENFQTIEPHLDDSSIDTAPQYLHFCEDASGDMWIGTYNQGVYKGNLKDGFQAFRHQPGDAGSLLHNWNSHIYKDQKGNIWIATARSLDLYLPKEQKFRHYPFMKDIVNTKDIVFIKSMLQDQDGTYWVGTNNSGLYRFDPSGEENEKHFYFEAVDERQPQLSTKLEIKHIFQDRNGNLWIGSDQGLFLKHKNGHTQHFQHDPEDSRSLISNSISDIQSDPSGLLWILSLQAGIQSFDLQLQHLNWYKHKPNDANSLAAESVTGIDIDQEGVMWISTVYGLNSFDPQKKIWRHYKHDPQNPNSISENYVISVYVDHTGMIWAGTWNGLNRLNPQTGKFIRFFHDPNDSSSLCSNNITPLYEDRKGTLWIGSWGGGISTVSIAEVEKHGTQARFVNYLASNNEGSLTSGYIQRFLEDSTGGIWIGTATGGLNYFNPESGAFSNYTF